MIASLILLAILTLGAVSASDNLTASETPDTMELGVSDADILVEEDVGDGEIEGDSIDDGRNQVNPNIYEFYSCGSNFLFR